MGSSEQRNRDGAGKGDRQRPGDRDRYEANYERIFGPGPGLNNSEEMQREKEKLEQDEQSD